MVLHKQTPGKRRTVIAPADPTDFVQTEDPVSVGDLDIDAGDEVDLEIDRRGTSAAAERGETWLEVLEASAAEGAEPERELDS